MTTREIPEAKDTPDPKSSLARRSRFAPLSSRSKPRHHASVEQLLPRTVVALCGINAAVFLYYFSVAQFPLPFWDAFDWIDGYLASDNVVAYMWAWHNEHRPALIRGLLALDIEWFSGSLYPTAVAGLVAILLILATLLHAATVQLPPVAGFVTGVVVFTLLTRTYVVANLVTPATLTLALTAAACSIGIWGVAFSPSSRWSVAGVVVAGLVASGSSANGLFFWPTAVWVAWRAGWPIRRAVAIGIAGAALWAIYFWDFRPVAAHGSIGDALLSPLRLLGFLALYFGVPWIRSDALRPLGVFVGAATMLVGVAGVVWATARRPRHRSDVMLLGVLAFALATAAATAVGRVEMVSLVERGARYGIHAALAHAAAAGFVLGHVFERIRTPNRLALGWMLALALGAVVMEQVAVGEAIKDRAWEIRSVRTAVIDGTASDTDLLRLYPDPGRARRSLEDWRRRQLFLNRD
jgi:hypothetical protein